jgi:hypothetical protein
MDAAQASLVSAWMAVSREQNDDPLVPPVDRAFLSIDTVSRPDTAAGEDATRSGPALKGRDRRWIAVTT